MIKGITSGSQYLMVNSSTPSYIGNYGISAGQMRYNTSNSSIEVYDGSSWQVLSSFASIALSYEAEEAIKWVNNKRQEEQKFQEKLDKHPTLKHAYEQFKIVEALVYEEEVNGS